MNPQLLPATARDDVPAWQQTVVAFLAEKERRSGSRRTVEGYARMLWPFLDRVGSPDQVTPAHVLAWAHGIGASGREPSSATVGARIACLSSYFRFLIRMNIASGNPCDALERPTDRPVGRPRPERRRGPPAPRGRARTPSPVGGTGRSCSTFVLTGRRRAEVIGLTAGDISVEGETAFYSYRGKGGKRGRRELPRPAYEALCATLGDAGLSLAEMEPTASLWQAGAGARGITSSTFYARFRRYLRAAGLAPTGLHILRHTRGEAPTRCRCVDRGGEQLPRPLEPGGHERLPSAARGRGRPDVAGGGGRDRRCRTAVRASVLLSRGRYRFRHHGPNPTTAALRRPCHRD